MIKLCRTQLVWILIYALEYVVSTNACCSHNSIWTNIKNAQLELAPHADFGSSNPNGVARQIYHTCKKWYGQREIHITNKMNRNTAAIVSSLKDTSNKNIENDNGSSTRYNIINEKSPTSRLYNDIDKESLQEISSKNSRQREKICNKIDKPLNFVTINNNSWKLQPSFTRTKIKNKYNIQPSEYHNDIRTTLTEKYNYLIKKKRKDTINWKNLKDEIPHLIIEISDQIKRKTIYQEITPDIAKCQTQTYHSKKSMSTTEPKTTYDSYYNIPIGNINIIYGPLIENEPLKAILNKIYLIILNGFKPNQNNGICLRRLKPLEQNNLKIPFEVPSNRPCYMVPTYSSPDLEYANNLTNDKNETFSTIQEISNSKLNMLCLDKHNDPSFITSYQTNKQVGPYIPNDDDMNMIYTPLYRTCQHQLPKSIYSLKYDIYDKLLQAKEERKNCGQRRPKIIFQWPFTTTYNPYAIDFSTFKSSVPMYLPNSVAKPSLIPIKNPYSLPYYCYCYKADLHKISSDTSKIFQQPDTQSKLYDNLIIKSEINSNLQGGVPKLKIQPLEVLMKSDNLNINNLKNKLKKINHPLHAEVENTPNLNNLKLNNILRYIHPILKTPYNFGSISKQSNDLGIMNKFYYINYYIPDTNSKSYFFDKSPELSFESQIFPSNKHFGLSLRSPIQSNSKRENMKWIQKYHPTQMHHANDIETPSTVFPYEYLLHDPLRTNSEVQRASICPLTIISSDCNLTKPTMYISSIKTLIRPNKSTDDLESRAKSKLKIDTLFATPHTGNILSLPITNQPIVNEGTNLMPSSKKINKQKSQKTIPPKFILKDFGIYKRPQYSTPLSPLIIGPESHLAPSLNSNFLCPPCRYKINSIPNTLTSHKTQSDLVQRPYQKQHRPMINSKSASDRIQIKVPKVDESDILNQVPKSPINNSWLTPYLPSQKKSPTKNVNIIPFSNQGLSKILPCQKRYKPVSSLITPIMEMKFLKLYEPSLQYISTINKNPTLDYQTTTQLPSEYNSPKNEIIFETPNEVVHSVAQEHNSRKSLEPTKKILDQTIPINEITRQKDTTLQAQKLCEYLNPNMPVPRTEDLEPTHLGLQNIGLNQKIPTYFNVHKSQTANDRTKLIFRQPSPSPDSQIFGKPLGPVESTYGFPIPQNLHMHVPKIKNKENIVNQMSPNTPDQPCYSNQVLQAINRGQFVSKIPATYASQTKQIPKHFKIDKPDAKGDIKHKILYKYPTIPSYSQNMFEFPLQQSPIETDLQHNQLRKTVETIQPLLSLSTFPTQSAFIASQNSERLVPEKKKSMYDQSQLPFNQIRLATIESEKYNLNRPVLYDLSILESSMKPNNLQAISELDPKITSKLQPLTNMLVNLPCTENLFSLPLIVKSTVQEELKPTSNLLENYKQISKQNLTYNLQSILRDFGIYKNSQYLSPLTSLNSRPGSHFPPCLDTNLIYPPSTPDKVLSGTILSTESNQRQERPIIYSTFSKNTNQIKCNQRIHETELIPKIDKKDIFKLPVPRLFSQLSPSITYQKYPQSKHYNGEIIPNSNQIQNQTLPLQNTYNPMSTSEPPIQSVATVHKNLPMNYRTPVQSPAAQNDPGNKIIFETSNESVLHPQTKKQIVRIDLEPPRENLYQTKGIDRITQPTDVTVKTQRYKDTNRYIPVTMTKELKPISVDLQQSDKPQAENDINHKLLLKRPTLPPDSQIFGIPEAPIKTINNSKIPQNVHMINSIPVKTFIDNPKVHTNQLSTNRPAQPYSPKQNVQKLNTDPLQVAPRPLLTFGSQFKQIPKYIKIEKPEINDKILFKHSTLSYDVQSFRIPSHQTQIETCYSSPSLKDSPQLSSTSTFPTQAVITPFQDEPTLIPEKYKYVHKSMFDQSQLPFNQIKLIPIKSENYNLNQPILYDSSIYENSIEFNNIPAISELAPRITSKLQTETETLVNMPRTENLISLPLTEKSIIQEEIKPKPPSLGKQRLKQNLPYNLQSVIKDFGIYKNHQYLSQLTSPNIRPGSHFPPCLDPNLVYPPRTSDKYPIAKKVQSGTIHSITRGLNQRRDRPIIYSTHPTDTNQLKTNEPVYKIRLIPNIDEKDICKLSVPKYPVNSSWLSPSLLSKDNPDIKRNNAVVIPYSSQILSQTTPSQNIKKPISSFNPSLQPPLSLISPPFIIPSALKMFGTPLRHSKKETIYNSPNLSKSHKPTPIFLDNVKQTSQQNLPYKPQSISKDLGIYKNPQYLSSLTSVNIGAESHLLHPDTSWLSPSLQSTEYQQTKDEDIIPYSNQIISQVLPSQDLYKPRSHLNRLIPVQSPSDYVNPRNKMVVKTLYRDVPEAQKQISRTPLELTIKTLNEIKRINEIHQPKLLVPETQKLYDDANKNTAGPITGKLEPTNLYLQELGSNQQAPTFLNMNNQPVNYLKQEVIYKQPVILYDSQNFNIPLGQHPSTCYNSPQLLEPSNQKVHEAIAPSFLDLQPKQLPKIIEMIQIFEPQFTKTIIKPENDDVNKPTLDTSSINNSSVRSNKLLITLESDPKIISKLKPEKDSVVNTPLTKNLYSLALTENIECPKKNNQVLNLLNKKQASKQNLPYAQSYLKDYEMNKKPQYCSPLTSLGIGPESQSPPSLQPMFVYPPSIPLKYSIPYADLIKKSYQKQKGPIFYSTSPRDTNQLKPNEYSDMSRLPQIKSHLKYSHNTSDQRTSSPDSNLFNKQLPEQLTSSKEIYNPKWTFSKFTEHNPLKASMLLNSQLFGIQFPLGGIHKPPFQQSLQELTPTTLSDGQQLTYNRVYSNTPNVFHNLVQETLPKSLQFATSTPPTFASEPKQLPGTIEKIQRSKSTLHTTSEYEKDIPTSFLNKKYNYDLPKNSLVLEKPTFVQTNNNATPIKTSLLPPQASILSSIQIPQFPSETFTPLDSHQVNTPLVVDKSPSAFNSHGYISERGTSPAISSITFSIPLQNDKPLESTTRKSTIPNSSMQLILPFEQQGISPIRVQESEFPYLSSQLKIEFPESLGFNQPLSHEILKPCSLLNKNTDKSKASKYNLWPVKKTELFFCTTKGKTQGTFTPNQYLYSPKPKSRLTPSESSSETSSTPRSATTSPGSIAFSAPVKISNIPILDRTFFTQLPLQTKVEQNLHSLLNDNVITSSNQGKEYVPSEPSLEPSTLIVDNNKAYQSSKYTAYEDKISNYVDHDVLPNIGSSHQESSFSSKSSYISSPPDIVIETLPESHNQTSLTYQYFPQEKCNSNFENKSVQNILSVDALSKDHIPEENTPNENENDNPSLFESQVRSPPLKTNSILEAIRQSLSNSQSPLNAKICELNTDYKTKEITIPLGELGIAKYEPTNIHEFCLKTDNPDIFLQAWNSKLKVIKPKLIFEVKDYEAINFMPVVKNNYYPPELVQDIAKDVITKLYSEPIVIHGVYSYYKPYAVVDHVNYNFMRNGCAYILWPTFCDCGCMQSGCTCRYQ